LGFPWFGNWLYSGEKHPSYFSGAALTTKTKSRISEGNAAQRGGNFRSLRTLARPDEWALGISLRVDARNFTLEGGEYVRKIIRDYSQIIVIPKGAQMRLTVTALTRTLHNVLERKWNGLYLLPLKTGAIPFVQGRIDPIIDMNPLLDGRFSSVDNRLHKQTSDGVNFYVRGTNIQRELQEFPVDFEIWDERDRMVDEHLEDARHRMDGSKIRQMLVLSTPTVEGYGVYADDAWAISDQHRWEVPCPGCNRFQVLNFNDPALDYSNVKLGDDAFSTVLECTFCKRAISDEERPGLNALGRWSPFNLQGEIRGYHISQLNSPTQQLSEIMNDYFAGQREARKFKSFWNLNMGRPYAAPGDKLTPELLDKCRMKGYTMGGIPNSWVSVGIDVGTKIHVWCWHFARGGQKLLWNMKLLTKWSDLDDFLSGLVQWSGVIDAHPEKKLAADLALKYHGKLRVGFSEDRMQASEMAVFHPVKVGEAGRVNIDKSMALDTFIQDFINGNAWLPVDARDLGENMPNKDYNGLYHQLTQMVRLEEENTKGTIVSRWAKNRNPDHWHHAGMFATVAAQQQPSLMVPPSVSNFLNRNVM
jgi:hypothetical protein